MLNFFKKSYFLITLLLLNHFLTSSYFKIQNITWHNQKDIEKIQSFLMENPGFYDKDMDICFVPKIKNNSAILLICKSITSKEICGFLFCELDIINKTARLSYNVIPEKFNNQKQEIYSLLLQEMQNRCKAKFIKMLYFCVNKELKQFYTKFGFYEQHAIIGTVSRLITLENSNIINMQKKI